MRILITDKHFPDDIDIERATAPPGTEFDVFDDAQAVTEAAWTSADAIITYRASRVVTSKMQALSNCRIIIRGGVGFDGLDLEEFGNRGVVVSNVPDYGTTEVADHAIAMFLALRRGITSYHDKLRADPEGNWHYSHAPLIARLRGVRFGIVGLGRIGTAAARRAQAFDQEVVFYDPLLPMGADLATGFTRADTLEEVLEICDAVSLHTPLTDATREMINARTLAHMKQGALLINTSRGPVIEIDAVHDALKSGHLAGAGLDVLPTEPPPDHPLIRAYTAGEDWLEGRLILSPHSAFFSIPGQADVRRKATEQIVAYLQNGELRNCVNGEYLRRNSG